MKSSKKSKPNLKRLKAKAWKLMSEWVRSKDRDKHDFVTCYTCPTYGHWRTFHCGHHFHGKLDYDERNLRVQCPQCNKWKHGNLGIYAARLIEENGLAWYQQLKKDANQIIKYDAIQLNKIINNLEAKLLDLEKKCQTSGYE